MFPAISMSKDGHENHWDFQDALQKKFNQKKKLVNQEKKKKIVQWKYIKSFFFSKFKEPNLKETTKYQTKIEEVVNQDNLLKIN